MALLRYRESFHEQGPQTAGLARDVSRLLPEDLVDGALREGDDEQVAVRPGLDVGGDAEVGAEEQGLALRDVVLRVVVGYQILEPWVVHRDLLPVAGQVEAEEVAALSRRSRRADEEVIFVLVSERSARQEVGTANFQLNSGSL